MEGCLQPEEERTARELLRSLGSLDTP